MLLPRIYRASIGIRQPCRGFTFSRSLSTLPNHPHIYYFPDPQNPTQYVLSLLPTEPPTRDLALGTTPSIPPESDPSAFTPNESFLDVVQSVLKHHAIYDDYVQSSAAAYASQAGSTLSGGFIMPPNHPSRASKRSRGSSGAPSSSGAGPTGSQGGAGGAGLGGWVHVSDLRHPPDFGRIADPEDIFGSVEVDGEGCFVGEGGSYQKSGTYRIVTRDGILGLSNYLRKQLVERLQHLEKEKVGKS